MSSQGVSQSDNGSRTGSPPGFLSNHLRWRVGRPSRTFVAHVVEPLGYDPPTHGNIFDSTMNDLLVPKVVALDGFRK